MSPGLASVPAGPLKARIDEVYPEKALGETFYADLPYGRTKFALSGPNHGRKARFFLAPRSRFVLIQ